MNLHAAHTERDAGHTTAAKKTKYCSCDHGHATSLGGGDGCYLGDNVMRKLMSETCLMSHIGPAARTESGHWISSKGGSLDNNRGHSHPVLRRWWRHSVLSRWSRCTVLRWWRRHSVLRSRCRHPVTKLSVEPSLNRPQSSVRVRVSYLDGIPATSHSLEVFVLPFCPCLALTDLWEWLMEKCRPDNS